MSFMDKAKDVAGDLADKAGDLVDKVEEKIPDSVKEKAGDLADKAGELVDKAKDKLGLGERRRRRRPGHGRGGRRAGHAVAAGTLTSPGLSAPDRPAGAVDRGPRPPGRTASRAGQPSRAAPA